MAMKRVYRVHGGRVRGESSGGVSTTYLTDALGSVTATVDRAGSVINTYRHKPYGGLLARTGTGDDPRYLWTGDTGSRTTGLAYGEQYNRARHYGSRQAAWTSVDPLWPEESAYGYVGGRPSLFCDPSGLVAVKVHINGFINTWVSRQYGLDGFWFPEAPDLGAGPFLTSTSNRDKFQSLGDDRDKLYGRVSIDSCDIGRPNAKSFAAWLRVGLSHRKNRYTNTIYPPRRGDLKNPTAVAYVRGPCTLFQVHAEATYPYLDRIAPAVSFTMHLSICKLGPGLISLSGLVDSGKFPDYDVLFASSSRWYEWQYARATVWHPSFGLNQSRTWNLPQKILQIEEQCCDQ